MESEFLEFAHYLFTTTSKKIGLEIETTSESNATASTEKTDVFEFMTNLLIYGIKKFGFDIEKIQTHFDKIDKKIVYKLDSEKINCPYEITKDLQIVQKFQAEELVAMYIYEDKYAYFSFN